MPHEAEMRKDVPGRLKCKALRPCGGCVGGASSLLKPFHSGHPSSSILNATSGVFHAFPN